MMQNTVRNLICALVLIVMGGFTATRVLADDLPTFAEPEVNAFVKSFSALADETVAAYKANDSEKVKALETKGDELSGQVETIMGKLKPDEMARFSDFITAIGQRLDAASDGK